MEDDFNYSPARLAEFLAAAESPSPDVGDAPDAPSTLVEALRASALAYLAELSASEQDEILGCLPQPERDGVLDELPLGARERLRELLSPETVRVP